MMTVRMRAVAEPLELRGDALDGALRLGVGVEQVAGDQDDVDLLVDREGDGGPERRELALALGGGRFAEIGVACAEVDVCGVKQSEHPVAAGLPVPSRPERRGEVASPIRREPPPADWCERGAPWPSLATPKSRRPL